MANPPFKTLQLAGMDDLEGSSSHPHVKITLRAILPHLRNSSAIKSRLTFDNVEWFSVPKVIETEVTAVAFNIGTVPCTDAQGWKVNGVEQPLGPGKHAFLYEADLQVSIDGTLGSAYTIGPFPISTADPSTVNLSQFIELDQAAGAPISVLDRWSDLIESAELAASTAQASQAQQIIDAQQALDDALEAFDDASDLAVSNAISSLTASVTASMTAAQNAAQNAADSLADFVEHDDPGVAHVIENGQLTRAAINAELGPLVEAEVAEQIAAEQVFEFTTSGTITKPAGAKSVRVILFGAGGRQDPGAVIDTVLPAAALPSVITVTVGAASPNANGGHTSIGLHSGQAVAQGGGNTTSFKNAVLGGLSTSDSQRVLHFGAQGNPRNGFTLAGPGSGGSNSVNPPTSGGFGLGAAGTSSSPNGGNGNLIAGLGGGGGWSSDGGAPGNGGFPGGGAGMDNRATPTHAQPGHGAAALIFSFS